MSQLCCHTRASLWTRGVPGSEFSVRLLLCVTFTSRFIKAYQRLAISHGIISFRAKGYGGKVHFTPAECWHTREVCWHTGVSNTRRAACQHARVPAHGGVRADIPERVSTRPTTWGRVSTHAGPSAGTRRVLTHTGWHDDTPRVSARVGACSHAQACQHEPSLYQRPCWHAGVPARA